jgi:FeS assembly SUF system regulator
MLRVTKLTDYATVVLTALAVAPLRVHSAAELAERARLELPTVSKVLKPLAHAGLVTSFRGASGGYRLARPPGQITLIEIVEAIEGRLGMTECSGEHSNCEHESHCGLQGHWQRINGVIAQALRGVSLAEMLPRAQEAQKPPRSALGKSIPLKLASA